MPEGDVVWYTARRLDEALSGRPLTAADFRVPRFATADLRGRSVLATVSYGKHLLTRVEGDVTVHTHLKMDGSWRIGAPSAAPVRDHRVRLVLANSAARAIGHRLGIVEIVRTAREDTVTGHLGPDLLGPGWDPAEAVRRLAEQPGRPIGEALLDQTRLAGIGTIFRAETLFLEGIGPWRPVSEIPGLTALVTRAHDLLEANKARQGQLTTGIDRPGSRTWAYGRARRPCLRCGTPIREAMQGDPPRARLIYWCPRCQAL